jgi:hypothetical protein
MKCKKSMPWASIFAWRDEKVDFKLFEDLQRDKRFVS